MNKNKTTKLYLAVIILIFASLACTLVTGSPDPTATPVPDDLPAPADTNTPASSDDEVEVPTDEPEVPDVEPESEDISTGAEEFSVPDGELGISTIKGYQDEWDSWIVVGLVVNNTDRAVDYVEVEVEVLDSNGASLYKEVTYGALYTLAPGEVTPFTLWVWDDLPDAPEILGTIVGFSATEVERADVEIRGTMMTFGNGYVNVTGELVNNNAFPIEISDLAAATFDNKGQVMTGDSDDVAIGYLEPGDSGPFRVSMDAPGVGEEEIVDFTVYTNVEVADSRENYEISFLEETGYFDTDGDYHLVGELRNDSGTYLNISLLASFYDTAGNVLDASYVDIPSNALAPGETTVYDFYSWYPMNYTEGIADQADTYVVQVDYSWTWENDTIYVDMPVTDGGFEESFWGINFTGQVTNDSGGLVDGGKIIVVLRSKETGELIGMGYESIFDDIPTGGSMDYDILVEISEDFDLTSFDYTVIAKGDQE